MILGYSDSLVVSNDVSKLALTERSVQMEFGGCILLSFYVFTKLEVHSVMLFNSVYVFFKYNQEKES